MLTYVDPITGQRRFKRRYIWAFWSFGTGIVIGWALAAAF